MEGGFGGNWREAKLIKTGLSSSFKLFDNFSCTRFACLGFESKLFNFHPPFLPEEIKNPFPNGSKRKRYLLYLSVQRLVAHKRP